MPRAPLNDLSAFAVVAEQRSFRRAAARLEISPSALSHAIRALEERLGVRLLNRTTRSVGLTDAGARLAARLVPALTSVDEALAELRDDGEQLGGRIRITTMDHGGRLLADVLPSFQRLHPAVHVEIHVDHALVDLAVGGYDGGVRLKEQVPADMVAVPIAPRLSMSAVASPEYLDIRGSPDLPADLSRHHCLRQRLTSGSIYRWEFEEQGAGICYVPSHHVAEDLKAGRLVRVLARYSPEFDGHCFYYPPYRHQTRAFVAFVKHLRDGFPSAAGS